ncbi:MAG: glycosyltransferase family 2 protein [Verrucomicrobiales bacterium]|nr:glycosyltransferase family 2 protein [Verrucomicrobiales bacterium]
MSSPPSVPSASSRRSSVASATAPELSIIIPAYNEERRLPLTLPLIRDWVEARGLHAEVIVVDDASTDGTAAAVYQFRDQFPLLYLLTTGPHNHGKGYAVRTGMLAARGRLSLFTDADLSAPIEEADKLLAALESCEVAIGSRAVDRSLIEVHQSRRRELAGIAFNKAVQLVTGLPLVDTQCGFKAFVTERARVVFEQQRIESFGFDPEILFLAKRHGLRIREVPVRWSHDPATKVRVLSDGLGMFADLFRIRWHALRHRYPTTAR